MTSPVIMTTLALVCLVLLGLLVWEITRRNGA